ncbi:MAG: TRAP transporter small permease [Pseudomonadota bacterium]
MALFERLLDAIDGLANAVAVALTAAIIFILLAQIFFRYGLNISLVWSEEVATWCMVWVVYLGSISIMRRWEHVHVPLCIRFLPLALRPWVIVFAKLATCVCVAIVAVYGVQSFLGRFHIVSQTTGISTGWIKLAVPVGAALMTLMALGCVADDLKRWIAGDVAHFRRYGELDFGEAAEQAPLRAPGS